MQSSFFYNFVEKRCSGVTKRIFFRIVRIFNSLEGKKKPRALDEAGIRGGKVAKMYTTLLWLNIRGGDP